MFNAAQLLLSNERSALVASLASGKRSPGRAQAAGLIMVYADDPYAVDQFTTPLVRLVADPNPVMFFIGHKAVERHPDMAINVLRQMVREGSAMAAYELTRFGEPGQEQLRWLARNTPPKGRAAAMAYLDDLPTLKRALNDPDSTVVREAVRRLLSRADLDNKIEDRLLGDPRPKVRTAAAILAGRWSQQNWPLWIKLTHDPLPAIRRVAMLHMVPLGLDWGKGPWISDGIAAVKRGFHDPSPAVRKAAIMAVRGWLLEWDTINQRWTPPQIAAAEAIIGSDAFYTALGKETKRANQSFGSDDQEGIQMAPIQKSLRISSEVRQRRGQR